MLSTWGGTSQKNQQLVNRRWISQLIHLSAILLFNLLSQFFSFTSAQLFLVSSAMTLTDKKIVSFVYFLDITSSSIGQHW